MTILAIDPGNIESAYVFWEDGKPTGFGKVPSEDMGLIVAYYAELPQPPRIVCEMIASYGMAVGKEVFETCLWIGRFQERCYINDAPFELVYRREVKLHHCNSVKAKDANIIQALKDRFGDKGTKANPGFFYGVSADVWQAIALAVYVADRGVENAA